MSKIKKRKKQPAKQKAAGKQDIREIVLKCLRASIVSLVLFFALTALLALAFLKKEVAFQTLRILCFVFAAVSFLLCGFLAVRWNKKTPAIYVSGAVGLFTLCILLGILAILSGGTFGNIVWGLVAGGIVLPVIGGMVARRI